MKVLDIQSLPKVQMCSKYELVILYQGGKKWVKKWPQLEARGNYQRGVSPTTDSLAVPTEASEGQNMITKKSRLINLIIVFISSYRDCYSWSYLSKEELDQIGLGRSAT